MPEIGDLSEIVREKTIEWKITDFLLLLDKAGTRYESPQFYFYGESWNYWIFPNGKKWNATEGWISIYIFRRSTGTPLTPVTMDFSFSLKTDDWKSDFDVKLTKTFGGSFFHWMGFDKFIRRSVLIERKSDLLPSGILTVICTLNYREESDATGKEDSECAHKKIYVDAFAQTDEGTGNEDFERALEKTCVDAFSQTDEGTGNENSERAHKKTCVDAFSQTNEKTGIGKLKENFKEILLNGNVSDVVLRVEGQEFKSHRSILAARSPVFLVMMTHDTREKATGVVDIQDVDPNTFPDFLNYLYTGSAENVTSENAHKLYATSDIYQVNDLKNDCLNHMLNNISIDNFCDIFTLSLRHNEKDLKDACIKFFTKMSLDIIKTSKWQTFLCENPITGNELFIKHFELNK